jgi:hypothetical protein
MVERRRRSPEWLDRTRDALQILTVLAGEIAKLIDAVRHIC